MDWKQPKQECKGMCHCWPRLHMFNGYLPEDLLDEKDYYRKDIRITKNGNLVYAFSKLFWRRDHLDRIIRFLKKNGYDTEVKEFSSTLSCYNNPWNKDLPDVITCLNGVANKHVPGVDID